MDLNAEIIRINKERLKAWEEGKALLDESRGQFDGEQQQKWEHINAHINELDAQRDNFILAETREREAATLREATLSQFGEPAVQRAAKSEAEQFAAWARGEIRGQAGNIEGENVKNAFTVDLRSGRAAVEAMRAGADSRELRALLWDTGSSGTLVPTELSSTLYQYMTASVAMMMMPTTKVFTAGGNPLDFPKVLAHGIGTAVIAQGTAIGGTDPTFSKMTLNAYKYGQLLQLASETISDAGVDILGFVAQNVARAVGEYVATDLVTGSGSSAPNGVMTALAGAGTIATGGSLIDPTYEKLVDLVYSVNGNYRARNSSAFLMRDLTVAAIRKLRDSNGGTLGQTMWLPSPTQGIQGAEPDRLLGYPVYTDPNVASLASNAKVIAFGDFSAYYIRVAQNFVIDRSDEYAFNTDLVTFRGKTRVDGDLIDSSAINVMKRSV